MLPYELHNEEVAHNGVRVSSTVTDFKRCDLFAVKIMGIPIPGDKFPGDQRPLIRGGDIDVRHAASRILSSVSHTTTIKLERSNDKDENDYHHYCCYYTAQEYWLLALIVASMVCIIVHLRNGALYGDSHVQIMSKKYARIRYVLLGMSTIAAPILPFEHGVLVIAMLGNGFHLFEVIRSHHDTTTVYQKLETTKRHEKRMPLEIDTSKYVDDCSGDLKIELAVKWDSTA